MGKVGAHGFANYLLVVVRKVIEARIVVEDNRAALQNALANRAFIQTA